MAFHIKIGNYRFSKNLGTGSFGKVKRIPPLPNYLFILCSRLQWHHRTQSGY